VDRGTREQKFEVVNQREEEEELARSGYQKEKKNKKGVGRDSRQINTDIIPPNRIPMEIILVLFEIGKDLRNVS
jgi:hypothetical protein